MPAPFYFWGPHTRWLTAVSKVIVACVGSADDAGWESRIDLLLVLGELNFNGFDLCRYLYIMGICE